jgi:hypothetical protein
MNEIKAKLAEMYPGNRYYGIEHSWTHHRNGDMKDEYQVFVRVSEDLYFIGRGQTLETAWKMFLEKVEKREATA